MRMRARMVSVSVDSFVSFAKFHNLVPFRFAISWIVFFIELGLEGDW